MTSKNEFINGTCLDGLEILKEHNLVFLATPAYDIFADHSCGNGELVEPLIDINEESKETYSSIELMSSWSDKIKFDQDGFVISLDLGGRRLYRGLPFDPAIFGTEYFPRLATLSLAGTDLPLKDILKILPYIESTIECLYLGGNGLGAKGARAIAESGLLNPETPSKLIKLDLRYNDISGAGMQALSTALVNKRGTNVLQSLYLEGNSIGDEGCEALSALLVSQKTVADDKGETANSCGIKEVYLGANKIGPVGAESIASVLKVNKRISKIYLEGNALGPEGAKAFCNMLEELKGDTGLKHLYVDNNNIGKELSNRLAKALRSDTVIEDF